MQAKAILRHTPTSPRKMRLVVDMVRGKRVGEAIPMLRFTTKHAARTVLQTLKSAVSNFTQTNPNSRVTEENLYITEAFVNQGVTVKRLSPAPMGRGHRIRKRSNHLTIIVDSRPDKKPASEKVAKSAKSEKPERSARAARVKKSDATAEVKAATMENTETKNEN
ncbi:MAG: 50S ribosomal protein L22 [Rhizobacter sp.]|nr:50S ribosomal protein L22 [Chlorobiales bacterium]